MPVLTGQSKVFIIGKDTGSQKNTLIASDEDSKSLRINNWVWDTAILEWIRMKQPTIEMSGDLTVTMGDVERLLAENYWKDTRYEYVSGLPVYKGLNIVHKASEGATTWYVWKLTWSSGTLVRKEGPLVGSWTGRAALAWG